MASETDVTVIHRSAHARDAHPYTLPRLGIEHEGVLLTHSNVVRLEQRCQSVDEHLARDAAAKQMPRRHQDEARWRDV